MSSLLGAACTIGTSLVAVPPAAAADWRWSVTPYFWLSEFGADVSINDHEVAERGLDLADLIDATDFALMLHAEGQRGKHGLLLDLLYADLGDDDIRRQLSGPIGGVIVAKGDLETTILEAAGIYNPRSDGQGFGLLYGMRMLDTDEEIDARIDFGPGSTQSRRYSASTTLFDGMLGVRYLTAFSERWLFNFRADASAGGTELTWNTLLGFGYTLGAGGRHALLAGYRYMEVEFEEEDRHAEIETQLKIGGPYLAMKLGF